MTGTHRTVVRPTPPSHHIRTSTENRKTSVMIWVYGAQGRRYSGRSTRPARERRQKKSEQIMTMAQVPRMPIEAKFRTSSKASFGMK